MLKTLTVDPDNEALETISQTELIKIIKAIIWIYMAKILSSMAIRHLASTTI
jgi:hypothetical protein